MSKCIRGLVSIFFLLSFSQPIEAHDAANFGSDGGSRQFGQFRSLGVADNVTVMLVGGNGTVVSFHRRLREDELESNSCVHDVRPERKDVEELVGFLDKSVVKGPGTDLERPDHAVEARGGLVFRQGERVLDKVYFENWGGRSDVKMHSNQLGWFLANASLPSQIETWLRVAKHSTLRPTIFDYCK